MDAAGGKAGQLFHLGKAQLAVDQTLAFGADHRIVLCQHLEFGIFAQVAFKGLQLAEHAAPLAADEQLRRGILDPAGNRHQ